MKNHVILLAGGKGSRMNASVTKVLLELCGKAVIRRSAEAFISSADDMVIVCRENEEKTIRNLISLSPLPFPVHFTSGGNTRQESVLNGIKALTDVCDEDIILIHDAARCLVDYDLISRVIESVKLYGSGVPGIPASSTYKICDSDRKVLYTPDRSGLYEIQTPQGFSAGIFIPAALKAADTGIVFTDDAGILEHFHIPVRVVRGSSQNIKLTEPEDISRAVSIIKGEKKNMRVGMGYDVHRLAEGRKLILCGVEIPYHLGLLGHSDADVALHALMDAMLGACALGDIGKLFPDNDDAFLGADSMVLLKKVVELVRENGYVLENADCTVIAQRPKLSPYIDEMRNRIALTTGTEINRISVKATTEEKLGFTGEGLGIAAHAVVLLREVKA